MNLSRSIALQDTAKARINDAIGAAISYTSPSATLRDKIMDIMYVDCKNAPRWLRSYLWGYSDAAKDQMIRAHIVHGKWHDGRFYCTYRNHPDFAEAQPGWTDWKTYGEWPEPAAMYWRDKPARLFYSSQEFPATN